MGDYPTEGTIDDVAAWVDGDPTRAQQAIDMESARANPRKGVLDAAQSVLSTATPVEQIEAKSQARRSEATFRHRDGRVRTVAVGSPAFARYDKFPGWERA